MELRLPLVLITLAFFLGTAFLAPSPSRQTAAPAHGAWASAPPQPRTAQKEGTSVAWAALGAGVALALKAARGSAASRKVGPCRVALAVPEEALGSSFAGATAADKGKTRRGLVACRSVRSCYTLYFRRWKYYEDRARRNLRNRAYNIWMKNRYKKAMKKVLRFGYSLQQGDWQPKSHQEVMDKCKNMLDEACEVIDEVTVQGVLHRNTAAKRKDRMFRCILSGSVKKGVLERPSYKENPENRFLPAYKIIGYELPECNFVREPRPWQLPGWKSPWMLKWEWEKWRKATGRK